MSSISSLNSLISNAVTQNAQSVQPLQATNADTTAADTAASTSDSYGPATNVDLSAPAKTIVAGQTASNQGSTNATAITASSSSSTSSSGSGSSSASGTGATSGSGGGSTPKAAGGAVGGSSTSSEISNAVTEAKRKVAAQVGTAAANELVDKNGNIDKVGLAKEVARQAQQKAVASGQSLHQAG